jgi:hypothetical protein
MDPYLEGPAHWPDFHLTFINCWREALSDRLPSNYSARIGERVYLIEGGTSETRRLIWPDVAVSQGETLPLGAGSMASAVATLEPVTIPLVILEEAREPYIEILHRPDRTLVAILELLSPANKEEPGRTEYLLKRNALLHQSIHLVELDLLHAGRRLPLREPLPPSDYYAFISRLERRPDCQVYHWQLPRPLPGLPIPLRAPDPDVIVDLQAVFAVAYERGRYRREIDYSAPLPFQATGELRQWIADQIGKVL